MVNYWTCRCGKIEIAQEEYLPGDWEPCIHCDGTARVITSEELCKIVPRITPEMEKELANFVKEINTESPELEKLLKELGIK